MFLQVSTQFMENYSDSDTPYLKFKGGTTYTFMGNPRTTNVTDLLNRFRGCVELNGSSHEYITAVSWVDNRFEGIAGWEDRIYVADLQDHFVFTQESMSHNWDADEFYVTAIATWEQVAGSYKRLNYSQKYLEEAA